MMWCFVRRSPSTDAKARKKGPTNTVALQDVQFVIRNDVRKRERARRLLKLDKEIQQTRKVTS